MGENNNGGIPLSVKTAFEESEKYFPTALQMFQFFDKYSRFNYEKQRRETWIETVDRSISFLKELSKNLLSEKTYDRVRQFILEMKAAPSMRLLAMAGDAAHRQNASIYNCSYLPVDSLDSFVEELIIAMAGTGVGYSVERKYVNKLPIIQKQTDIKHFHVVQDSTEGWAEAFKIGIELWFKGDDVTYDYSKIRKAGAPLKIKGGRASGPEPLKNLLDFTRNTILSRQGQKLRSIDAHDISCKIGEAIVSGGVRRTALIALFDIDDEEMRNCKNGENLIGNEQRWMANNSAVWTEEMTQEQILKQMYEMMDGQRGEPGIFSRINANKIKPRRRKEAEFGTNPCGEINLRPYEFCNLSMAIARKEDTLKTLLDKVEVATIIGTIQSMGTNFPGLRPIWQKNCEEERLLGVDITGQLDCPLLRPDNKEADEIFKLLKRKAIETNRIYAKQLGINQSASVTCVKPSGNSSQLFDCSSGLHARWSDYYIRNVRVQNESPIKKLMEVMSVPMDPENGQTRENANTWVIHFPVKSPKGAVTRKQLTAIDQCEHWLKNKKYWTEHNPSVTISYRPTEVIDLIKWVWDHKDIIGGMSFLPISDAQYNQMPYDEVTEEQYNQLADMFPVLDFSKIWEYEREDFTTASTELACVSGACSIDDYYALKAAKASQGA